MYHTNINQKTAVAISTSNRLQNKNISRDKRILYNDERLNPTGIHSNPKFAPNSRGSKHSEEKLIDLKRKINKYSILVRDFSNSLSPADRPAKQHTSNNTDLNNIINHPGLIDIYKTFHPTTAVYKLVFKAHKKFTNMEVP